MTDNVNELNVNDIEKVAGGTCFDPAGKNAPDNGGDLAEAKRAEFEAAWNFLKMDSKGYSVNHKAAIFKEWELNDYQPGAMEFLKSL